jgi:hypothetical protein
MHLMIACRAAAFLALAAFGLSVMAAAPAQASRGFTHCQETTTYGTVTQGG